AGRPEDDYARAWRAVELLRARNDLRGSRRVRRSRADPRGGAAGEADRPPRVSEPRRVPQPPGAVRQDDRSPPEAVAEGTEQSGGVLYDFGLLLGEGVPRLQADREREARLRRQGRRGG